MVYQPLQRHNSEISIIPTGGTASTNSASPGTRRIQRTQSAHIATGSVSGSENKWGKLGSAARRLVFRRSVLKNKNKLDKMVEQDGPAVGVLRANTPIDVRKKSDDLSQQRSPSSVRPVRMCLGRGKLCAHCEERRVQLAKLSAQIERLREVIISDSIVTLEPPEDTGDISPEVLELAAESVKLRITLDALCRFQMFTLANS